MIGHTSVQEFFPTPVWTIDLKPPAAQQLNGQLLDDLERLTSPRPHDLEVGGFWQTQTDMHVRPEFAELTKFLRSAIKAALDFLQVEYRDYEITACWANFGPPGSGHSRHTHPNNYFSGVYYVRTPPGADTIDFFDPRPGAATMMPRTRQLTRFNGNRMTVKVHPGRLIIFPSWLLHGVPVNPTNQERVSIAFNVMFSEFTESMAVPMRPGNLPFRTP